MTREEDEVRESPSSSPDELPSSPEYETVRTFINTYNTRKCIYKMFF